MVAAFTLNAPVAQAGGNKHYHGHGYHTDKVPTYLMDNLDETAQDSGALGTMWAGAGIPSTNFILRRYEDAGIELAIKAHLRFGADILPTYVDEDGIVHVEVPAGHQTDHDDRAKWNFAFSYDVALDPGNSDLEDYRGTLLIDLDPSPKTDYLKLRLSEVDPLPSPPDQPSGYGWTYHGVAVIPDDEGNGKVTQNSQNLGFYLDLIDVDPHTPGVQHYDPDFGPGQFDVVMTLGRWHQKEALLHVVFDVVEP
jgi:hypothetical protein